MFGFSFRRLTGLLAMLLLASQSSTALCVAIVCLEQAPDVTGSHATAVEHHVSHSGDHEPHEGDQRQAPSEREPLPPDCQIMALCMVAAFDPAARVADPVRPAADRATPPVGFVLHSRVAAPETPPPRG